MDAARPQQFRSLGLVFTGCGITFLTIGLATHRVLFTTLGTSMLTFGIVFFAFSRTRKP